jgi:hypothetical protein
MYLLIQWCIGNKLVSLETTYLVEECTDAALVKASLRGMVKRPLLYATSNTIRW